LIVKQLKFERKVLSNFISLAIKLNL
jgi:hypothetical protein